MENETFLLLIIITAEIFSCDLYETKSKWPCELDLILL